MANNNHWNLQSACYDKKIRFQTSFIHLNKCYSTTVIQISITVPAVTKIASVGDEGSKNVHAFKFYNDERP